MVVLAILSVSQSIIVVVNLLVTSLVKKLGDLEKIGIIVEVSVKLATLLVTSFLKGPAFSLE